MMPRGIIPSGVRECISKGFEIFGKIMTRHSRRLPIFFICSAVFTDDMSWENGKSQCGRW